MLWEQIINTYIIKFGLLMDSSLLWNKHIDQLMSKLSTACMQLQATEHCSTQACKNYRPASSKYEAAQWCDSFAISVVWITFVFQVAIQKLKD